MNVRIHDDDVYKFMGTDNIEDFDKDDKYRLFNYLSLPINYSINKAFLKFPFIPLEKSDFDGIAWMGFSDALKKYNKNTTRKSLISFIMDSIYWKCIDYACVHINNRHRILNVSYPIDTMFNSVFNQVDNGLMPITTKVVLDDYFVDPKNDPLAKKIFFDYVEKFPITEMSKRYNISRNKIKKILDKTLSDLSILLA